MRYFFLFISLTDESKCPSNVSSRVNEIVATNFERSRSLDITKLVTSQLFASSHVRASNAPISLQQQSQAKVEQQQSVDNNRAEGTSRTNSAERTTTATAAHTGKSHYYDSSGGVSSQPGNPSCIQGKTASSEAMSVRSKIEGASGDESHIKAGKVHHTFLRASLSLSSFLSFAFNRKHLVQTLHPFTRDS